ncbi:hypothetical protein NQZ68_030580 [Dissostichus eleginoides]|uniref:Ubiquinone biosynthesis protein coq-4 mitochondrial n=1 Tax=Dissostichus eleginoides TaxID=100907 RepID=A0AAD9BU99_DISEL|nr:hypothetical protein NQZ68_030580 [Dissostichus eleginoides]KAK1887655.1 Ubiquinone biosynthesis protein coq-4 mitochondrial [Dissostichus eleginoides]KAK1888503.1 Ubiquinone biosynthesis protein coq-4 mitochondrial [Dissostichus eleginoides]
MAVWRNSLRESVQGHSVPRTKNHRSNLSPGGKLKNPSEPLRYDLLMEFRENLLHPPEPERSFLCELRLKQKAARGREEQRKHPGPLRVITSREQSSTGGTFSTSE